MEWIKGRETMNREDEEVEMKEKRGTWGKKRLVEVGKKDQDTEKGKNKGEPISRWDKNVEGITEQVTHRYHKRTTNVPTTNV